MTNITRVLGFIALITACSAVSGQVSASFCGPIANTFGPFDFRPEKDPPTQGTGDHTVKLGLVEGAHFTAEVEMLIRARRSNGDPGGDIDYTLRAFPNHHRALLSVMRYGEKKASQKPNGLTYVVECYFERAIRFAADDPIVRMIYSSYLAKNKRQPEAMAQLEYATGLAAQSAFTHYNIGLFYFEMKVYDKALARAHRALELGFERTELADLLKTASKWQDPVVEQKP